MHMIFFPWPLTSVAICSKKSVLSSQVAHGVLALVLLEVRDNQGSGGW